MISATDREYLYRLLKYEKKPVLVSFFLLSLVGFIISALGKMGMADLPRWLERAYLNPGTFWITLTPLYVVAITLIQNIGFILSHYFMNKLSRGIIRSLRSELLGKLLRKKQSFYDKRSANSLLSLLIYHVEQVYSSINSGIINIIQNTLTIIALLGYLLYLNAPFTLILLGIVPIAIIIIRQISKRFYSISKKIQLSIEGFSKSGSEMLRAIEIIRLYSSIRYQSKKFEEMNNNNYTQNLKLKLTELISVPVLQVLVASIIAFMIWLAFSGNNLNDFESFGSFTAYVTSVILLGQPIKSLSVVVGIIQKGVAAAERVFDYIDNPEEENNKGKKVTKIKGKIVFTNITKSYNKKQTALNNINLDIQPKSVTALVGPSGSGKTTLAFLLTRFYSPNAGTITIDGHDIAEISLSSLRSHFSMVSQHNILFNDTLAKNIAYAEKRISKKKLQKVADIAHVREFLPELAEGFDTHIGDNGSLLSGGQRQRVTIARALYRDAPILILDEATSALDNQSDKLIQDAMQELMKGKTTIVIAHKLSNIMHADNIVVLNKGKIVQQGPHSQLITQSGLYKTMYRQEDKDG